MLIYFSQVKTKLFNLKLFFIYIHYINYLPKKSQYSFFTSSTCKTHKPDHCKYETTLFSPISLPITLPFTFLLLSQLSISSKYSSHIPPHYLYPSSLSHSCMLHLCRPCWARTLQLIWFFWLVLCQ